MAALFQRMFLPKSSFLQGLGVGSKWMYGTAALCRHITTCKLAEGNHDHHSTALLPKRLYSSETTTGPPQSTMSFEEYKKLKKALKVRARITGIPTAFVGIIISSAINVHMNPRMFEMTPEEITPIFGMDPVVFAALCGVGSGIVGFALGGVLFTNTWRIMFRQKAKELQKRDEDFFQRIERHRFSSFNRYEDDYYGDKVMTLSDYRQWVRQQQKKKEVAAKLGQEEEEAKKADSDLEQIGTKS